MYAEKFDRAKIIETGKNKKKKNLKKKRKNRPERVARPPPSFAVTYDGTRDGHRRRPVIGTRTMTGRQQQQQQQYGPPPGVDNSVRRQHRTTPPRGGIRRLRLSTGSGNGA